MTEKQDSIPIFHSKGNTGLQHMLQIDTFVAGKSTKFILDTGIGVNLISTKLCKAVGCQIEGATVGKRMTGQEISVPMTRIESLEVANRKETNVDFGVWDFKQLLPDVPEFNDVHGYLSLNFFEDKVFTLDYKKMKLIFEDNNSLKKRLDDGVVISLTKNRQGAALTIYVPVKTVVESILNMQLDLGTNKMTVNTKYIDDFKPFFEIDTLEEQTIIDETGFERKRSFVKINGSIGLSNENLKPQLNPLLMFQEIIYDGIIGNDYFKDKIVTFDLAHSRLIVEKL